MDNQGPTAPLPPRVYSPPVVVPAPIYTDPLPLAPPIAPLPPSPPPRGGWNWSWFVRGMLLVVLVMAIGLGLLWHRVSDFSRAVSGQDALASQLGDGRVSLVFLGYGGVGHDGAYLSDSLLVVTYDPATGKSAMISVPRDLWVQIPPGSGEYAKLNTAFAYGVAHGGIITGGNLAANKVTDILGVNVTHWLSLDFTGFAELVDQLGGLDITVPDNFVATLSPTYTGGQVFHQGLQHMDGTRALLFARARYCTPAAEASDFARSARQQLLLRALFAKVRSVGGWFSAPGVMDALQTRLNTDLSLRDLATILTHFDIAHATRIGLTNNNVLTDATSDDGQAILLPIGGNWGAIRAYVQQQLGG
ncbi:MAG: LCP family protein [Ktedonobacterales bacterium]|nr:LCP family protein [Ktedonobacterales bacterium]